MSYEKQNFVDGQTLTAAHLNHMEEGIAAAGGFTAGAKELLLTLFENAAYKTGDAQSALNALRAEWGGSAQDIPVQSVSLSAAILNLSEGVVERFARRSCYGGRRHGDCREGRHLHGDSYGRRQERQLHGEYCAGGDSTADLHSARRNGADHRL